MDLDIELSDALQLKGVEKNRYLLSMACQEYLKDNEEQAFYIIEKMDKEYMQNQLNEDLENDPSIRPMMLQFLGKMLSEGYFTEK